jgi:hypothetical protein
MNQEEILNSLIFCNVCYYPHNSQKKCDLLISYCMHIVCINCIKETDYCVICSTSTSFVPINSTINSKLKKTPSELFARPIEISMFQVNSSINLIEYMKDEINTYKKLLKLARCEIEKLKKEINPKRSAGISRSRKPALDTGQNADKVKKVCNIIKNTKRKSERSTSVLDFSNATDSSYNTGRLTIPKDFNPYKKFYRK